MNSAISSVCKLYILAPIQVLILNEYKRSYSDDFNRFVYAYG
jgi:hypothetical protein